jgi:hypothetical protein
VVLVANKQFDQKMLDNMNLNLTMIYKYVINFWHLRLIPPDDVLYIAVQLSAICFADDVKAK